AAKAGEERSAARCLCQLATITLPAIDAVVAIPANRGRRRAIHLPQRLAQTIAAAIKRPHLHVLTTTRSTAAQHLLDGRQRQHNVDKLYRCQAPVGKRILLVDDLLTTGATLQAASRALRQAGARFIHGWCLARTPKSSDGGSVRPDDGSGSAVDCPVRHRHQE
ncbi:MAG: ComF family protein, partial [Planctomycetota bacterium]